MAKARPNDLTLLVIKDARVPKAFRLPMGWLAQVGALAVGLAFLVFVLTMLAARYYRIAAQKTTPAEAVASRALEERVRTLESELDAARTKNHSNAPTAGATSSAGAGGGLSLLPAQTGTIAPDQVPITLTPVQTAVKQGALSLTFNILYAKTDGGNQQGRIVAVARGPGIFAVYPPEALNALPAASVVDPTKGEFFSVSRFRATQVDFPSARAQGIYREYELFVLDGDGKILAQRQGPLAAATAPTRPKATAPAEPADASATHPAPATAPRPNEPEKKPDVQ